MVEGQARDVGCRGFEAAPFCGVRMYTRWIARRMARCSLSLPAGSAICKFSVRRFSSTNSASVLSGLFRASGLTQRVRSHAKTVDKGQSSTIQPCLTSSPHISELTWHLHERCDVSRKGAAAVGPAWGGERGKGGPGAKRSKGS